MTFTFNLVALLDVFVALAGVWATFPELRGRPVKLWRLGLPPFLCSVTAIIMLSGNQTPHVLELMWLAAAFIGVAAGVHAGNRLKIRTDQMWGLVQFKPSYAGLICAIGILLIVIADSTALWMGITRWPMSTDPAIGAALLSGFLDGRGWRMATKGVRSPHADLNFD